MTPNHKVCTRCISDTSIEGITFDEHGVCNYCRMHDQLAAEFPEGRKGKVALQILIEKIKLEGKGKDYDCIVGVSGGRDSTFVLYNAVKLGLRPLATHFDNGWNSEIAVTNIKNVVRKLNVDLYTHVADWEEFKSLQLSFLRASVSDAEIPTDVAIFGTLHKVAAKEKVRYILNGHSFRTEGIVPLSWTYMDGRYINDIHRRFGGKPLKTVPNFGIWELFYYTIFRRIRVVPILNYIDYQHAEVDQLLKKELDWQYYGGHHHESYYTRFFQSYLLPQKFGIDKRLLEYSALVRSGQISREEALHGYQTKPYEFSEELVDYAVRKLDLSVEEFQEIIETPPRSFRDYSSYYPLIKSMKPFVKIASKIGLVPSLLYQKYFA